MEDFPCWQFLLRDSLALQHEEKIILSLRVSVHACVCARVCACALVSFYWQVALRESVWPSGLTDFVYDIDWLLTSVSVFCY